MHTSYIKETELLFGNNVKNYHPQIGLLKGGPYGPKSIADEFNYKVINCGVIGSSLDIAKVKSLIEKIHFGIEGTENTYGIWGFPGLGKNSPLQFSLRILPQWEKSISESEINSIANIVDKKIAKNKFIDIFEEKIRLVKISEPPPDIVFISLNNKMLTLFKRTGIESNNIVFANRNDEKSVFESNGDINFHNILKIIGMKYQIPTQILKPDTLLLETREDKPTVIWNLIVALYYKDKGIPWKFSFLTDKVCYVGISFFKDFSNDITTMNASLAQVFIHTGESFILVGTPFEWDSTKEDRIPHLNADMSKDLLNDVLKLYFDTMNHRPVRIVIYKSSIFTGEEKSGFYSNSYQVENIDFVTINERTSVNLYRRSLFPPLRGTLLKNSDNNHGYLYSIGYIPSLETFPGMDTPSPIEIRINSEMSDMELICKEIMILTRLDWNNIKYCQRLPVTLAFSQKIGKLLSERRIDILNGEIEPFYRYYM